MGEPSGPMLNGITYIVRPRIEASNSPVSVAFISSGATQLLVGPASAGSREQMKVRSSTRATSAGSDRAQKEFGLRRGSSRTKVPASTSKPAMRSHSCRDPSHHSTRSGRVSLATSRTHSSRRACRVGAASRPGTAVAVIAHSSLVAGDRANAEVPAVRRNR